MQHSPTRDQDADYLSQAHNRKVPAFEPSEDILLLFGNKDLCGKQPFSPKLMADRNYGLSSACVTQPQHKTGPTSSLSTCPVFR